MTEKEVAIYECTRCHEEFESETVQDFLSCPFCYSPGELKLIELRPFNYYPCQIPDTGGKNK